jgi:hypothetical protein
MYALIHIVLPCTDARILLLQAGASSPPFGVATVQQNLGSYTRTHSTSSRGLTLLISALLSITLLSNFLVFVSRYLDFRID